MLHIRVGIGLARDTEWLMQPTHRAFSVGHVVCFFVCLFVWGFQAINLEQNRIGGELPVTWCMMTSLTDLNLSANQIRGKIPIAIGNLRSLNKLKLGNNQLTGELPVTISKLVRLQRFEVQRCQLCGRIDVLGTLGALVCLKINENAFSG